jgi:hypothetical protein
MRRRHPETYGVLQLRSTGVTDMQQSDLDLMMLFNVLAARGKHAEERSNAHHRPGRVERIRTFIVGPRRLIAGSVKRPLPRWAGGR